jgi:3-phenylpropionate/trans-cinnamate dioxygenase ferredoxin component
MLEEDAMTTEVKHIGYIPVAKTGSITSGNMMAVSAGGKEILLARVGDRFYASGNRCPHLGGELSRGKLEGTIVTCPRHASRFDLSDGHVVRWTDWAGVKATVSQVFRSPRPLTIYPVRVEGDDIMVKLGD